MKKQSSGYLLVAPVLGGCLLFYILPFCQVMSSAFTKGYGRARRFVGLENIQQMLGNEMFALALRNTLLFLIIGLPLLLAISYLLALLLKQRASRHKALKTVLLFPYIMPVVGTVLLVQLLFSDAGLGNQILIALGAEGVNWLHSGWTFGVLLLLLLWKNTGYGVILLLAGLVTIPQEQYEAADMDGATAVQKFRYITTPHMWNAVFITTVFSLINAFKCFREIFVIGGKHPDQNAYMLQHFINNSFENLNYTKLAVACVLFLLILLALLGVFYSWIIHLEKRGRA